MGFMDLRKYNILVLPSGGAVGAVLNQGTMRTIRQWVESGGTLIAIGNSAATLARENGLSSVRRKRDVLDELDVYAEALEREIAAMNVTVDSAEVWGDPVEEPEADTNEDADVEMEEKNGGAKAPKGKELERLDAWQRRFSPRGIFASSNVNTKHWMAFSMSRPVPSVKARI